MKAILPAGVNFSLPGTVEVPGDLVYDVTVSPAARQGDVTGYIVLRREGAERRIPYLGTGRRAAAGASQAARVAARRSASRHDRGTACLGDAVPLSRDPGGLGVTTFLRGPEAVYRFRLTRAARNFGVVVTRSTARESGRAACRRRPRREPAHRLCGSPGRTTTRTSTASNGLCSAAGALSPLAGEYAVVFDSATPAGAGRFTFRFWIDDVTPPTLACCATGW